MKSAGRCVLSSLSFTSHCRQQQCATTTTASPTPHARRSSLFAKGVPRSASSQASSRERERDPAHRSHQAYPFPAFVLAIPSSLEANPKSPLLSPLANLDGVPEPVWTNARWARAAGHRSLLECLTPDAARQLVLWIDDQVMQGSSTDDTDDTDAAMYIDADEPKECSRVITLGFSFPRRTLQYNLVCTVLPQSTMVVIAAVSRGRRLRPSSRSPRKAGRTGTLRTPPRSPVKTLTKLEGTGSPVTPTAAVPIPPPLRPLIPVIPQHGEYGASPTVRHPLSTGNVTALTEHPAYIPCGSYVPGDPIFINSEGVVKATASAAREVLLSGDAVAYLLQHHDWASTPLGAYADWPISLRSIVSMMSVFPMGTAVWWGPELTFLYNQTYANVSTLPYACAERLYRA